MAGLGKMFLAVFFLEFGDLGKELGRESIQFTRLIDGWDAELGAKDVDSVFSQGLLQSGDTDEAFQNEDQLEGRKAVDDGRIELFLQVVGSHVLVFENFIVHFFGVIRHVLKEKCKQ